ncbi:unnamed protein product [Arctogadus glacialis]
MGREPRTWRYGVKGYEEGEEGSGRDCMKEEGCGWQGGNEGTLNRAGAANTDVNRHTVSNATLAGSSPAECRARQAQSHVPRPSGIRGLGDGSQGGRQ